MLKTKGLIILLFILLLFHQGWAKGQRDLFQIEIQGNWINTVSQEWVYGFFEKFAIYDTEFWDYKVLEQKGDRLHVVLEKDGREIELNFRKKSDKLFLVSSDGNRIQEFYRFQSGFQPYVSLDTLSFGEPELTLDSVLILGYYRNLDKVKPEFKETLGSYEVKVSYHDFLDLNDIEMKAPIDLQGRFRLKLPVYAPQRIFLDWGKLWESIVVVPGDTMMIYLDMTEFEPRGEERRNRTLYWNRNKDMLFMGENARLHREMSNCPPYFNMRNMSDLVEIASSDMEYLRLAEADYLDYMKVFADFYRQYPTLARRCIQAVTSESRYYFGANLMQNRFNTWKKKRIGFDDPAYMEYVNRHFSIDSVSNYFLTSRYSTFIRDYTGYIDGLGYEYVEGIGWCKTTNRQYANALKQLIAEGKLKVPQKSELEVYVDLMDRVDHWRYLFTIPLSPQGVEDSCLRVKYDYLSEDPVVKDRMAKLTKKEEILLYDTLIPSPVLREIITASDFAKGIENSRIGLFSGELELLKEKVASPFIREAVLELHERYRQFSDEKIRYPQSLINTDHLRKVEHPDSLWQALLAPYRGKVIYWDFWGTWCGPCKNMMERIMPIKDDFQDKDVIFMYFAYNSRQESWENVIREYNSSGENIVHYNLPEEQQKKILKLWNVSAFPTFMLIDRNGKVVNQRAPNPYQEEELRAEIENLLR